MPQIRKLTNPNGKWFSLSIEVSIGHPWASIQGIFGLRGQLVSSPKKSREALPFAGIAFCMETSEVWAPFDKDLDKDREPKRIGLHWLQAGTGGSRGRGRGQEGSRQEEKEGQYTSNCHVSKGT